MSRARSKLWVFAGLALLAGCGARLPVIASFTASPSEVVEGDPVTLSWVVAGATKLSIDPDVGEVTGGSTTVAPSEETTYTLTASSAGGSATKSLTVTVTPRIPATRILSFVATPLQIAPGGTATLRWEVTGTPTITIDHGVVVPALGNTATVNPLVTTSYTMSVQGVSDPTPITSIARVIVIPPPAISSFGPKAGQTATGAPRGSGLTLVWVSNGDSFSLSDGTSVLNLGTARSVVVRPLVDTTYTLTAHGVTGDTQAVLPVTVSGPLGSKLVYDDPPAGGLVRLVRDPDSTDALLVLDLVLDQPLAAMTGLGLNLPLDGALAGSRDGITRVALDGDAAGSLPSGFHTVAPGLDVGPAIPVWDAAQSADHPAAAMAKLPVTGPLEGVLSMGFSLKPAALCTANGASCAGATASPGAGAAGTVLARLRLKLLPAGGTGPVFTGSTGTGFRAELRDSTAGVVSSFALGNLSVQ